MFSLSFSLPNFSSAYLLSSLSLPHHILFSSVCLSLPLSSSPIFRLSYSLRPLPYSLLLLLHTSLSSFVLSLFSSISIIFPSMSYNFLSAYSSLSPLHSICSSNPSLLLFLSPSLSIASSTAVLFYLLSNLFSFLALPLHLPQFPSLSLLSSYLSLYRLIISIFSFTHLYILLSLHLK